MIKFLELRSKVKAGFIPAFALFGNDDWLKNAALGYIFAAYGVQDDGFSVVNLDAPSLDKMENECLTPTLFGGVKVVVCRNFAFSSNKKGYDEKKKISEIVAACDKSYCLVFLTDSDKPFDGIVGMEAVDCRHLGRDSVADWIVSFCKREGVTVDRFAATKLADYCLCDMSRVSTETRKLLDYGSFTVEAVEQLVHKDTEYVIFNISGAIADKNAHKALELYRGLLDGGEDARSVFAVMYSFYRRVYYVKISSMPSAEVAQLMGVKETATRFAKDVAARYKPMQLRRALELFDDADVQIKSFASEDDVMYLLIMQLVSL